VGVDDTIDGGRADASPGCHFGNTRPTFKQALVAAAGLHGLQPLPVSD
jgi:hypothetical protein